MRRKYYVCAVLCTLLFAPFALADDDGQDQGPGEIREKCDKNHPIEPNVVVARSVDGDTLHVKTKSGKTYAVRLIGVDTPETHYMGESQGLWGEKAAERLHELVPDGTRISLEFSPSVCDSYGRVLAHVFRGKQHVNYQLAAEGLAVLYCLYPSTAYCEKIGRATATAIRERRGMFTDSHVELPYDFRRRIANRQQSSFTGNLRTKEVFRPGHQNRVPPGERIFFQDENVPPPYHVVN